jgi:hypothetical protein
LLFFAGKVSEKSSKKMESIYISVKDIQVLRGCCERQAWRIRKTVLDSLGKKSKDLTYWEYCQSTDIADKDEFFRHLVLARRGGIGKKLN